MSSIKQLAINVQAYNKRLSAIKNIISVNIKIGRNDKCSCGSGLKFKKCCLIKK